MRSLFLLHDVSGNVIAVNRESIDFVVSGTSSSSPDATLFYNAVLATSGGREFGVRESFEDISRMMDEKLDAEVSDGPRRFDLLVDGEPHAINLDTIEVIRSKGDGVVVMLQSGKHFSVERSVYSIVQAILVAGVQPQIAEELVDTLFGDPIANSFDVMEIAFAPDRVLKAKELNYVSKHDLALS